MEWGLGIESYKHYLGDPNVQQILRSLAPFLLLNSQPTDVGRKLRAYSVIEVLAKNAISVLMEDSFFSSIHILLIFLSNSESNSHNSYYGPNNTVNTFFYNLKWNCF